MWWALVFWYLAYGVQLAAENHKVVGYYTSWAQFREGAAKFLPENVDGNLLTHGIYAFAKLDSNGHVLPFEHNDLSNNGTSGMYQRFNNLKKQYPHLKTLFAIGGNSTAGDALAAVLKRPWARQQLAKSVIKFAREHGFDGVDIDWEIFDRESNNSDKCDLLIDFLKLIRQQAGSDANFLLTVVAGLKTVAGSDYCLPLVAKQVDWINVIGYDFHGSWDNYTGVNAPLMRDHNAHGRYNINHLITHYLKQMIPSSKMVLSIPAYGRSYGNVDFGWVKSAQQKSSGPAAAGLATKQPGVLAFYEILELLKQQDWRRAWDKLTDTPFLYNLKTKEWVSYDDEQSVRKKALYIKKHKLAGAALWALPLDDFQHGYPLLSAIKKGLA